MNPFWMTMTWSALAVLSKVSGESELKFLACVSFAMIWGATNEIIYEIRKGRS